MNAKDIRSAITRAVAHAKKVSPKGSEQGAASFVAFLSGYVQDRDPALAAELQSVFGQSPMGADK